MCGRTACTLAPDSVVKACGFRTRRGRYQRPVWRDPPGGQQYYPSHNVAPASHTPVLVSSKHYPGELESLSERVVQPMKWGLVPSWHKGDPYRLEYETNNCRAEGMLTKKTYKTPLEKGNRCVILADGFFEWKRTKEAKQPYFIYFPQKAADDVKPTLELKTVTVKPDTDQYASSKSELKLEPVCVKPDPDAGTDQYASPIVLKQEPVCVKPDPDQCASPKSKLKSEPVSVKPDPDQYASPKSELKLEPVSVKPDPDAVPQIIKRETEEIQDAALTTRAKDVKLQPSSSSETVLKTEVKTETDETADQSEMTSMSAGKPPMKSHLTNDMRGLEVAKETALTDTEEEKWQGKRLLTMAGVFDVWQSPDGSPPLYSYSVITVDASPAMSWIHHRMPAILSTEGEISDWLDFAEVPLAKAVKAIHPTECITTHMVSPIVNNSRNKSPQCVELYDPKEVKKTASSNLMMNWLKKAGKPADPPTPDAKKQKLQ